MKGTFRQRPEQPHITLRRQLLDGSSSLSNPAPPRKASAADVEGVGALAQEQLTEHGVVAISLDRPMTNREYLAFGALLGTAQLEHSPAVQPFVEEGVILNLVTCEPATSNPDLQPFAANWLALHSESSSLPIAAQPRFVSLMCLAADGDSAAETVLVPMRQVFDALTDEDASCLPIPAMTAATRRPRCCGTTAAARFSPFGTSRTRIWSGSVSAARPSQLRWTRH